MVVENILRESGAIYPPFFFLTAHTLPFRYNRWANPAYLPAAVYFPRKLMYLTAVIQRCVFSCFNKCRVRELEVS